MRLQFVFGPYSFRVPFSFDLIIPLLPIRCLCLGARFHFPFLHTFDGNARVILFIERFPSVLLLPFLIYGFQLLFCCELRVAWFALLFSSFVFASGVSSVIRL